jgi:ATP synthase protein I
MTLMAAQKKRRLTPSLTAAKRAAVRLIKWQILLTLAMSMLFLFLWGVLAFWSGLVAGVVCLLATTVFMLQVLRFRGAQAAKQFLLAFWLGEAAKLLILGILSLVAVKWLGVLILPYMISFVVNVMVFWFAPFVGFRVQ